MAAAWPSATRAVDRRDLLVLPWYYQGSMASAKLSVSLSRELEQALGALAQKRGEDRSRVIETLLRENPLVAEEIRRRRAVAAGPPRLKKGRSVDELLLLARVAREGFDRRLREGKVKIRGWA